MSDEVRKNLTSALFVPDTDEFVPEGIKAWLPEDDGYPDWYLEMRPALDEAYKVLVEVTKLSVK